MQRVKKGILKGFWVMLILCLHSYIGISQCNDLPLEVDCTQAELFCNLDQLDCIEFSQVPTTFTSFPSYDFTEDCGGTIENPTWFSFVAWASQIDLTITYNNCVNTSGSLLGVQMFFFDACVDWDVDVTPLAFNCDCDNVYDSSGPNVYNVVTDALLIGQEYFVMIDGCAGNTCDVMIEFTNLPPTDPITGQVNLPEITSHTINNPLCEDQRICSETQFEIGFPDHEFVGGVDYTITVFDEDLTTLKTLSTDTSAFQCISSLPGEYTFDVIYQNICDIDSPPYSGTFTIEEPDTINYPSDTLCLEDAPSYIGWPLDWSSHNCFPSAMPGENLYECKYIDTCGCSVVEQKTVLVLPLTSTEQIDTVVCPDGLPIFFGGLFINEEMPLGMLSQIPQGTEQFGCDSSLFVQVFAPEVTGTLDIIGCTGLEVTYEVTLNEVSDYLDPNLIDILWYENNSNVGNGTTYTTSIDSLVSVDLSWTYGTSSSIVNCVEPLVIDTSYLEHSITDFAYPDVSCSFSNDTVFYTFSFLPVAPSLVMINQLTSFPNEWDGNVWIFPGIQSSDEVSIEMTASDGDCGVPTIGPINCSTQCTNYTIQFPQETSDVDCVDFGFSPIFLQATVSPSISANTTVRWLDENGTEVIQPFIPVDGIDSTYQFTYEVQDPGCMLQTSSMELSFAFPRTLEILIPDVYICEGSPINTDSIVSPAEGMSWFMSSIPPFDVLNLIGEHTEFTFYDAGTYTMAINAGTADCPSSEIRSFNVHVENQSDFEIRCLDGGYPIQFTWDNLPCIPSYDVYVNNEFVTNQSNATYTPLGYPPGLDLTIVVVPISDCLCDYGEISVTCNTGFCPYRETDLAWRDTVFCISEAPNTLNNTIELVGLGLSDNFSVVVDQTVGTTMYEQEIAFNALCSYKDTFYVTLSEVPNVELSGYGPNCYDDPAGGVDFVGDFTEFEDEVIVNGTPYLLSDLETTPFPPDNYTANLTAIDGCEVSVSFQVPTEPMPTAVFDGYGSLCFDEPNGGVFADLEFDEFQDEVLINGTTYLLSQIESTQFPPDSYTVDLLSVNGCGITSMFVVPPPPQDFNLGIDGEMIVLENTSGAYSLNIDTQDYESIDWYLEGVLMCSGSLFCDVEFGTGPSNTTLSAVISVSEGCSKTTEIEIEILELEPPVIFIPNIISFNNPGNSTWIIGSDIPLELPSVEVYDRWGNQVYSDKDLLVDSELSLWDGTFNGRNCEIGVYLYTITYRDASGELFMEVGDITLIR